MKILTFFLFALTALNFPALYGAHHQSTKALELLAQIAGDYTYQFSFTGSDSSPGQVKFELFANSQFLNFDETFKLSDSDLIAVHGIIGYDKVEEYFTWHRVFSNGAYDFGEGRLKNGVISFNITKSRDEVFGEHAWSGPGIRLRTKWMNFTETSWNFVWEQSKEGGPWELIGKGDMQKKS